MVYTLACDPSVEYAAEVTEFTPGIRNRSKKECVYAGGKGVNVTEVLQSLGVRSRALGFIAGFTGDFIETALRENGCETAFIKLPEGFSRINVRIKGMEESEIYGRGPEVPAEAAGMLFGQLELLQKNDLLLLPGDIPPGLPKDFYGKILERLEGRGIYTMADAAGEALPGLLRCRPFLVKLNRQELEEAVGRRLFTREEMLAEGRRIQEMGAENVLLSTAAEGALLLGGEEILCGEAPRGEARRSGGAGDALLAGFAAGWLQTGSFREALRLGIAAGSASVFCRAKATGEEIWRLYDETTVYTAERQEGREAVLHGISAETAGF